jgi:integrase
MVIRKRMWTRILKKAKVRYRYPYQMRHTYASMMLMAEESPQWVATQMGHTDWTFTARTYSRFIPDDAPNAGQKAVERWGNASKNLSIRSTSRVK